MRKIINKINLYINLWAIRRVQGLTKNLAREGNPGISMHPMIIFLADDMGDLIQEAGAEELSITHLQSTKHNRLVSITVRFEEEGHHEHI